MRLVSKSNKQEPTGRRNRGQSYVLEALGAGILIVAAVLFAIQATAVTPLSVSTASQHVENQERLQAETMLDVAARNGTLRSGLLYWNPENETFVGAEQQRYVGDISDPAPNEFLAMLGRVFSDSQIATNVYVTYNTAGSTGRQTVLYQGVPSGNAVSAGHTVVLYEHDKFAAGTGFENRTLNDTSETGFDFYAPNVDPNSPVYNVVEVRIVVWRM